MHGAGMPDKQEVALASSEVRRVAAAARNVAERIRADASGLATGVQRVGLPMGPASDDQPGRSPRSPIIGRRKCITEPTIAGNWAR